MTYDYSGTLSGALTADGKAVSSDGETYRRRHGRPERGARGKRRHAHRHEDGTLTKSGDDTNGDNCNFYGINSILLAVGDGSAGLYLRQQPPRPARQQRHLRHGRRVVYASGDTISTTADNSRGLDATYGGTIVADGMTIATQGDHCAAIATDRGGGSSPSRTARFPRRAPARPCCTPRATSRWTT
jgi:hypothetical protein